MPKTNLLDHAEQKPSTMTCSFNIQQYLSQWLDEQLSKFDYHIRYQQELEDAYNSGQITFYEMQKRRYGIKPRHIARLLVKYIRALQEDVSNFCPPLPAKRNEAVWYSRFSQHPLHKNIVTPEGTKEPALTRRGKIVRKWIPFDDALTPNNQLGDHEAPYPQTVREQVLAEEFPTYLFEKLEVLKRRYQLTVDDIVAQAVERAMRKQQDDRLKEELETDRMAQRFIAAAKRWDDKTYRQLKQAEKEARKNDTV
jgi:hypothetical protein